MKLLKVLNSNFLNLYTLEEARIFLDTLIKAYGKDNLIQWKHGTPCIFEYSEEKEDEQFR